MSRRIDWNGDMIQRFVAFIFNSQCATQKSNRSFIKWMAHCCSHKGFIIPLCVCVVGRIERDPDWVRTRWIVVCLFICYPLSMYCAAPMHDYTRSIVCFQCLKWLIRIVCYVVVVIHRCFFIDDYLWMYLYTLCIFYIYMYSHQ